MLAHEDAEVTLANLNERCVTVRVVARGKEAEVPEQVSASETSTAMRCIGTSPESLQFNQKAMAYVLQPSWRESTQENSSFSTPSQ